MGCETRGRKQYARVDQLVLRGGGPVGEARRVADVALEAVCAESAEGDGAAA